MSTSNQLKKLTVFVCLLCFASHLSLAQSKMDSLKQNIAVAKGNDSLQAERYADIAFAILNSAAHDLEEGIDYINKSIKLAEKRPNISQLIVGYNYIGLARIEQGRSEDAINAYKKALSLAEKEYQTAAAGRKQTLEMHIPLLKGNVATIYNRQGKLDEALAIRLNVIKDVKKQNDKVALAKAYTNISSDFIQARKYRKGIEYALKGIAVYEVDSNNKSLPFLIGNIGICYNNLGIQDSAMHYFLMCRKISKNNRQVYLDNEADIAKLYTYLKKYDLATETFTNLFAQYPPNSENAHLNRYKLLAAETYLKLDNYPMATKLFNEAKDNVKSDLLHDQKKLSQVGLRINRYNKNYKEALQYSDLFHSLKDSLFTVQRDSSFHLIESKYNVAKKQETINAQKLKLRNFSLGLLGLLALCVFASLLFYNYRKKISYEKRLSAETARTQKAEIENLQQENKIISMQSMLEGQEEERKRIARDLHDNIGTLMTSIKMKVLSIQKEVESIENMNIAGELDGMIDNASQEVRRISHSMTPVALDISGLAGAIRDLEPQLAAKNIEFNANLEAIKNIDDKNLSINIYRIVQEIFNNIVKHSQADAVSVDTAIRENDLILRIRDNGTGIPKDVWEDAKSVGIESLKSRVTYLNGQIKLVADIGTHYKITIPIPTTES